MIKYSILTFIIGKGYEKVHEICNKQRDVEYLLITDDITLTSKTWTVIYDKDLLKYQSAFERCFRIRYNVFKYCSSSICITIDGSMHIKGSLDKLVDEFNKGNYDICLMPHPLWSDLITEYNAWIKLRNYPITNANRAIDFLRRSNYNLNYQGLYQLCFTIKRKTYITTQFDDMTFSSLEYLSDSKNFERLDQPIFSYILNQYFNTLNILAVSEQIVRSYAIQWYWHNSDNPNMNIFYDINKPDIKYVFNKPTTCLYLLN